MIGLGGSNLMGIGLAVILQDSFTRPAASINRSILQLSGNSQKAANANTAIGMQMAGATVGIGAALLYGASKSIEASNKYQYALTKVGLIADISGAKLDALKSKTEELAVTYGLSSDQIMESNLALAKAGVQGQALNSMAEAIAALSKSADEPAAEMGDKLVNMMTQFGISSRSSMHFADELTQAANKSTIDIKDMFQSVSYAGATAHNLKIPFEQVATQIALIGNAGIKGSSGGTQLANMYRYLAQSVSEFPLKRQQQALAALKINPRELMDASGNLKDMGQMIDLFSARTRGMSSTRVQNLTNAIFGPRGSRAFIALMAQGRQAYDKMYVDITNKSAGLAKSMALQLANTPEGRRMRMFEEFNQAIKQIGLALTPLANALYPVIAGVTHLFTSIIKTPVGRILLWIGTGFVVMRTAIAAVRLAQFSWNKVMANSGTTATQMARLQTIATGKMKINLMALIGLQKQLNSAQMGQTGGRYPAGTVVGGRNVGGRFASAANLANTMSIFQSGRAVNSFTSLRNLSTTFGPMARGVAGATAGLEGMIEFFTGPWGLVIAAGIAMAPALDNFGYLGRVLHGIIVYLETLLTSLDFTKAYKAAEHVINVKGAEGRDIDDHRAKAWNYDQNMDNMVKALHAHTSTTINLTIDGKKTTQNYINNNQDNEINAIMNL